MGKTDFIFDNGKDLSKLGKFLKNRRKLLKIIQKDMAKKVGQDPTHLCQMENAPPTWNPTIRTILRYVTELGCELVIREKPKQKPKPK